MREVFIFGHKKPDTDSVTSAIALANLKNSLGITNIKNYYHKRTDGDVLGYYINY